MFWPKKRKNLNNNAVSSPRDKRIEEAETEHREANQAYVKAEHDGASSDDIRDAKRRVQRALKSLDALTGTHRPRRNAK